MRFSPSANYRLIVYDCPLVAEIQFRKNRLRYLDDKWTNTQKTNSLVLKYSLSPCHSHLFLLSFVAMTHFVRSILFSICTYRNSCNFVRLQFLFLRHFGTDVTHCCYLLLISGAHSSSLNHIHCHESIIFLSHAFIVLCTLHIAHCTLSFQCNLVHETVDIVMHISLHMACLNSNKSI